MIRTLRPTDVVRQAFFRGVEASNRAQSLDSLIDGGSTHLTVLEVCREAISLRRKGCCWAWVSGRHLRGMARARQRSGPRAWEVAHLFLSPTDEEGGLDLLEQVGRFACQRGAERVFLRLLLQDPVAEISRRAGFFPYFRESLYQGYAGLSSRGLNSIPSLRPRHPDDDLALFRLYNAATPSKVRTAMGLTLDQWKDSQERYRGSIRELVYEKEGVVTGWLRINSHSRIGQLEAMVHPEDEGKLEGLVSFGIRELEPGALVTCMVPEYQIGLQHLLADRGLKKTLEYQTTVKFLTVGVPEKSVAPAKPAPV